MRERRSCFIVVVTTRNLNASRIVRYAVTGVLATLLAAYSVAEAQSLRGSRASVQQQHRVAVQHDFTFLNTPAEVRRFVNLGFLVPVRGNANYEVANVSFPYARPEVRLFIERLAAQYRSACRERLVVTSLTRPRNRQPPNASPRSVHPTGMAVDLRRSHSPACRRWLEDTLLSLERQGLLNATREMRPPHYHIAVFPTPYRRYVERLTDGEVRLASAGDAASHRVRRGESLWTIARARGTTVEHIQRENGLRTSRIHPGQVLRIPGGAAIAAVAAPQGGTYRVSRGDSLWTIARRHGTTVDEIKHLNNLPSARIYTGQELVLPAR